MFKGTHEIPVGQFSKIIARVGGRDNAFTSTDYTAYYQSIAADRLDLAMKLEADRMRNLVLDEKNVETERAVIMEERRSRTDNNPSALLSESMEAALFLNHPYHRPIIGWAHEIAKLDRQDALDFYARWYSPNNAVLVVAGDVTPSQVKELAEKWFGPIPRGDIPNRERFDRTCATGRAGADPEGPPRRTTETDQGVSGPQRSLWRCGAGRSEQYRGA